MMCSKYTSLKPDGVKFGTAGRTGPKLATGRKLKNIWVGGEMLKNSVDAI